MVDLKELILTCLKSAQSELWFLQKLHHVVKASSFWMIAISDGRAQRAHCDMLEISSIRTLFFAKASSFWMMVATGGRARRAHSESKKVSSI